MEIKKIKEFEKTIIEESLIFKENDFYKKFNVYSLNMNGLKYVCLSESDLKRLFYKHFETERLLKEIFCFCDIAKGFNKIKYYANILNVLFKEIYNILKEERHNKYKYLKEYLINENKKLQEVQR